MKMRRLIFDLETTGTDTQWDRIVQIAVKLDFGEEPQDEFDMLINPTIPIKLDASAVHGITDDMVKDKPTFADVAETVLGWFEKADEIITYNGNNFDIPLLMSEFGRAGHTLDLSEKKLIDVLAIERRVHPQTLSAVYERYTGDELTDAHDALADVKATLKVLEYQEKILSDEEDLEAYSRDGKPRADISGKFAWEDDTLVWTFGKNKGKDVKLDKGYADWFLKQDFPKESKEFLKKHLNIKW